MPGSWKHTKAEDIQKWIDENRPETVFISRKPTNTYALLLDKKTGRVLEKEKCNGDLMDKITDPNYKISKQVNLFTEEEMGAFPIKTRVQNIAISVLCLLTELEELTQSACRIKIKDGKRTIHCDSNLFFSIK
jgi:hypothetical protein